MARNPTNAASHAIKGYTWIPPQKPTIVPPGAMPDFPYVAPTVDTFKAPTQAHGLPLSKARAIHETLMRPWDSKDLYPRANVGPRVINPTSAVPATRNPALPVPANIQYIDPYPLTADVNDLGPAAWQATHKQPITIGVGFVPPVNPTKKPKKMGVGTTGPRRGVRGQVFP